MALISQIYCPVILLLFFCYFTPAAPPASLEATGNKGLFAAIAASTAQRSAVFPVMQDNGRR
jgi:hypothetical protein